MKLTALQKHLIKGLKIFGVPKEEVIPIILFLKDNEEGMNELIDYMENNHPTADEIVEKSAAIAAKAVNNQ